jgi:hypothetical protein
LRPPPQIPLSQQPLYPSHRSEHGSLAAIGPLSHSPNPPIHHHHNSTAKHHQPLPTRIILQHNLPAQTPLTPRVMEIIPACPVPLPSAPATPAAPPAASPPGIAAGAGVTASPAKRKRIACTLCRESKVRCVGPSDRCARCERLGVGCRTDKAFRRSNKRRYVL